MFQGHQCVVEAGESIIVHGNIIYAVRMEVRTLVANGSACAHEV